MVLSASQVMSRVPVRSNVLAKIPASLSSEPGCTTVRASWKQYPVFQSQNRYIPLSPPANRIPCLFTEIEFRM